MDKIKSMVTGDAYNSRSKPVRRRAKPSYSILTPKPEPATTKDGAFTTQDADNVLAPSRPNVRAYID